MWFFIEKHMHFLFCYAYIHIILCGCNISFVELAKHLMSSIRIYLHRKCKSLAHIIWKNALGNVPTAWQLCHNNRMYSDGETWLLNWYLVNNGSVPDMTILTIDYYTCHRTKYHFLSPNPINTRVSSCFNPLLLFTGIRYYRPRQVIHGRKISGKFPLMIRISNQLIWCLIPFHFFLIHDGSDFDDDTNKGILLIISFILISVILLSLIHEN